MTHPIIGPIHRDMRFDPAHGLDEVKTTTTGVDPNAVDPTRATMVPGEVTALYLYSGALYVDAGDVTIDAGSPLIGSGRWITISGGDVTAPDDARLYRGGSVHINAGTVTGTTFAEGGILELRGGQPGAPGGAFLRPGAQSFGAGGIAALQNARGEPIFAAGKEPGGTDGIGFFGLSPLAPQPSADSSTVTAAQIWQALAAIGLVEDTA